MNRLIPIASLVIIISLPASWAELLTDVVTGTEAMSLQGRQDVPVALLFLPREEEAMGATEVLPLGDPEGAEIHPILPPGDLAMVVTVIGEETKIGIGSHPDELALQVAQVPLREGLHLTQNHPPRMILMSPA